jgi:hypothetical protein
LSVARRVWPLGPRLLLGAMLMLVGGQSVANHQFACSASPTPSRSSRAMKATGAFDVAVKGHSRVATSGHPVGRTDKVRRRLLACDSNSAGSMPTSRGNVGGCGGGDSAAHGTLPACRATQAESRGAQRSSDGSEDGSRGETHRQRAARSFQCEFVEAALISLYRDLEGIGDGK